MTNWMAIAEDLDRNDPLAEFKSRFVINDPDLCYLDGNSLGRLPVAAIEGVNRALMVEWGDRLIRSWNESWLELPVRIASKIARILNVASDEVLVGDSTSINLHKLASGVMRNRPNGDILTELSNFPSDLYVLAGLGNLRPFDTQSLRGQDWREASLASFSHVDFRSGRRADLSQISSEARDQGVPVLWDLSHSAGVVPLNLSVADMAVGCGYKYLNGGPGAPAFLYVRRELQEQMTNPIPGWFGTANPFAFNVNYESAPGIQRFQISTPNVLSMTAMEAGIDLYLEAGADLIWQKAVGLTSLFIDSVEAALPEVFTLATPKDPDQRGAHVTLKHSEAWRINQALNRFENVIPDYREPDGVRFGFSPLTTSYREVAAAVERLSRIMQTKSYEQLPLQKPAVT